MKRLPLGLLLLGTLLPLAAAPLPRPAQVLGFPVGADRKLADWQQIVHYFRRLDGASDRLRLVELGRTTLDNPFVMAIISHPANLEHLERYREIQRRLADPRLARERPEDLFREGRTVVLITCAIHSTEVASAQTSMRFAYDLAAATDAQTAQILKNVILLLVPSLNPDGVNIVNHWYWKTLGSAAEGTAPPQLYHHYVGHDNNRDWTTFTQKETRLAIGKIQNVWHPQIVFDVHQMGPYGARIFVPPFIDPIDPNVDPILQGEIVDLGGSLFSALLAAGRQGVVTQAIYDAFTPARAYQHYHGGVRMLAESASARLATPIEIEPSQLRPGRNYDPRRRSWNFPVPWPGGRWTLGEIVRDQEIVLRAALLHAARNRETWLRNFYAVGQRALQAGPPYAFVIPVRQPDRAALHDLLDLLAFAQVEIQRARLAFSVSSAHGVSAPLATGPPREFPAGTFIIPMQQPYSSFARTMLEIQHYPERRRYPGGPLERPYDVTAQTLGMQLGVEVYQVDEPLQVDSRLVAAPAPPAARLQGEGEYWLFRHSSNDFARLANRLLARGGSLAWAPNGFQIAQGGFPAGTLLAQVKGPVSSRLLEGLALEITRLKRRPELAWSTLHVPRIGLYQNYRPSIDEGWTRWILEQYEFPYHTLHDADIRAGRLDHLDVIILPSQSPDAILEGLGPPYPEKFRGGLGSDGLAALKSFVRRGGTLLFLGDAVGLALSEWGVQGGDVTAELSPREFYVPGSLLRVEVHNRHPIGFGMPRESAVMFRNNPVLELREGVSVARYSHADLLLSGWISGKEVLAGRTALAEIERGEGRLILIPFRTQFRAQTRVSYKFLFNSLYYAAMAR